MLFPLVRFRTTPSARARQSDSPCRDIPRLLTGLHIPEYKKRTGDQNPVTGPGVISENAIMKNAASTTRMSSGIITARITAPSARLVVIA